MKLLKKLLIALLVALVLALPSFALAESDYEEGDGWTYQDGELTILSNQGLANFLYYEEVLADASQDIPVSDVDRVVIGKDVTDIAINDYIYNYSPSNTTVEEGNQAFLIDNGWVVNKTTKTLFGAANVKQNQMRCAIDDLPSYIEYLGMYAFNDCSVLKTITIPKGVVSIGESCFNNCDSLESIALPSTVTSIGIGSFSGCTSLKHIDFGSNVKEVGAAAFVACIHLETPTFYNMKLETIYGNSFLGCNTFQTVELPPTLKKVEGQALGKCDNLNTLVFNSDQLIIENDAFSYCENVKKLIFTKGKPASIGDSLFNENEKTPDGKSFITRLYDPNGKIIPYPTLYYTAAYANEWAPNGETEWNGYTIQQISQEELDAILAEARGEDIPMVSASPVPTAMPESTAMPLTDTPATPQKLSWPVITETIYNRIFLFLLFEFSVAVTISVALTIKNRRRKLSVREKDESNSCENKDLQNCMPNEVKRPGVQSKQIWKALKTFVFWFAGIPFALLVSLVILILGQLLAQGLEDAKQNNDITCSATATEYVNPTTAERYFDINVNAPNGSVVRLISEGEFRPDRVTIDTSNVILLRVCQDGFLPNTPQESDSILITPKIEVTLPNGKVVQPVLSGIVRKVPVLEIFVTNPTTDVIEIPEDQESIQIAGRVVVFDGYTPVYINDEQVYVDEVGNFDCTVDLTQPGGDVNADETVTVEARLDNCKTARKTITIHRISAKNTNEEVVFHDGSEEGDGWTYQDGELTILSNQGLANFLYYEEVLSDASHEIPVSNVDRVIIGKDVTDIAINDYIYNYSPSDTTVEEGNQTYVIDNGWVVNKTTKTLFGAANVKQNQKSSAIDDLPTYIEHISMYAFNDCSALQTITIPKYVVSMGEFCFNNCDSLESVALPSTVVSIGVGAFNHCTSLKHVDFGPNVKEIGAAAFDACIRLETPSFQNMQLDTIYGNSFWGCDTFQTVEFSPSLRLVENQAFAHSSKLTSLIFHSDQLIIENGAFDACENIRKLVFTKGKPTSIGDSLFNEDERTPDGKSFITRLYDPNGKVIPYPTLYYTAAYADEWAPNGETEWNGYPIQQISQEELDAILAEARDDDVLMASASPVPTETPLAETPAPEQHEARPAPALESGTILLLVVGITAIAIVGIVILRRQKAKK